MSLNAKISRAKSSISAPVTEGSSMKGLLAAPAGLVGLMDYLEGTIQNAEEAYKQAAMDAVFNPEGSRMEAVRRFGRLEAFRTVLERIEILRVNGE